MQATVVTADLVKALSTVNRAVAGRSTLPVLANVLLATDNGRLKVRATDLSIAVTAWIGAIITEEGALTVPAKTLSDLVRSMPAGQVGLTADLRRFSLALMAGRTKSNVKGIDAQEFPLVPVLDPDTAISLPPAEFRRTVEMVAFAAAADEARPILTGVQLSINGDVATMSAVDGFRLARRTMRLSAPVAPPVNIVIPGRALTELARLLDAHEALLMEPRQNQVIFRTGGVEIVAQLVEGTFPDVAAVMPKRFTTRAIVPTAELLQACRTAEIFAREAANTARFRFVPAAGDVPGQVVVLGASAETGDNVGEVDATLDGPALEIAFNVRYMREALAVADAPRIILETTTPTAPGVLRIEGGQDDYAYTVMPMHIG